MWLAARALQVVVELELVRRGQSFPSPIGMRIDRLPTRACRISAAFVNARDEDVS